MYCDPGANLQGINHAQFMGIWLFGILDISYLKLWTARVTLLSKRAHFGKTPFLVQGSKIQFWDKILLWNWLLGISNLTFVICLKSLNLNVKIHV